MEPNRRFLHWLLEGTRGGPTRVRLLHLLFKKPMNLRQLALAAGLDYSTVEHHVRLLERHSILASDGPGYGRVYSIDDWQVRGYLDEPFKGEIDEKPKTKKN